MKSLLAELNMRYFNSANGSKNMLLYIWDQRIPSYRIFINFTNNAANLQFSLHKSEKHLIYTQSYRFPDPDKYRLL